MSGGASLSNGKCFIVSTDKAKVTEASTACQNSGSQLVTMTAENHTFLYGLAHGVNNKMVWIGLTAASGSWAWVDGGACGYTDWGTTEPDPGKMNCGQAVASASTEGNWDEQSCTAQRYYRCVLAGTWKSFQMNSGTIVMLTYLFLCCCFVFLCC